jgi:hypothetical protein
MGPTVQRRRYTEDVVRKLFEKYRGKTLESEFEQLGVRKHEVDVLFDEMDLRFGDGIVSFEPQKMDAAVNGAFLLIAGMAMEKKK